MPQDRWQDETLDELPPLDGDGEDEASPIVDDDITEPELDTGTDDATGQDEAVDPAEFGIEDDGEKWSDDALSPEDASDLAELDATETSWLDDDATESEADLGSDGDIEELTEAADAGQEGPEEDDEPLREEDLPTLDADEEGEVDDAQLIDADLFQVAEKPSLREIAQLQPVGAPPRLGPARAIALAAKGIVVAADNELFRIDLEGACERINAPTSLATDVVSIACIGSDVFFSSQRELLRAGEDAEAIGVKTWRACTPPDDKAVDVVSQGETLWLRTASGALLASTNRGARWSRIAFEGAVACIGADSSGGVVAIALADKSYICRCDAEAVLSRAPLPDAILPTENITLAVAGLGPRFAFASPRGLWIYRCRDEWSRIGAVQKASALVWADDVLLCAGESAVEGGVWVFAIRDDDSAGIAATLTRDPSVFGARSEDDDGPCNAQIAMLRDIPHGVVWVSGAFGVIALETEPLKGSSPTH